MTENTALDDAIIQQGEEAINPDAQQDQSDDDNETVVTQSQPKMEVADAEVDQTDVQETAKKHENPPLDPVRKVGEVSTVVTAMINAKSNLIDKKKTTSGALRAAEGYTTLFRLLKSKDFLSTWRGNPIALDNEGTMLYVKLNDKNMMVPARSTDENAIGLRTITRWTNESRQSVDCITADGATVQENVSVQTLIDAHLLAIMETEDYEDAFEAPERQYMAARAEYATTGSMDKTDNEIFTNDDGEKNDNTRIKETAQALNLLTVDELRSFAEKTLAEIKPAKGVELTQVEKDENKRRADVLNRLSDRFQQEGVATPDLIADVLLSGINMKELVDNKAQLNENLRKIEDALSKPEYQGEQNKNKRIELMDVKRDIKAKLDIIHLYEENPDNPQSLKLAVMDMVDNLQSGLLDGETSEELKNYIEAGNPKGFLLALQKSYEGNADMLAFIERNKGIFENKLFLAGGLLAMVTFMMALRAFSSEH